MKNCTKCNKERKLSDFRKQKHGKGGKTAWCITCCRKYGVEYYNRTREKQIERSRTRYKNNREIELKNAWIRALKRKYGITEEQYNALLSKQNGCCAICGKHYTHFRKRLAVDHDHTTNEIRGLLCNYDNHRFIGRHRDIVKFKNAVEYLEQKGTGWFVPKRVKRKKRKRK